jgi:DNA polymerase III delta prime subunit
MDILQDTQNQITRWVESKSAEQPLLIISSSHQFQMELSAFARQLLPRTTGDAIEITGEKNRIRIKDISYLRNMLATKSEKRIICIPHTEQLLPEAANTLLKILEEPSTNTRFLLGAKSTRGVLPTIRSRCRIISVNSLKTNTEEFSTRDMLQKLSDLRVPEPFKEEELLEISRLIHQMTLERGASAALWKVSSKLRDYYKTANTPSGNTKLAADILLASLANLRNTTK